MEYLRTKPINGAAPPILIQVTRGDRTTVNPTVFDAIHAGRLEDRVTLYRHDLLDARDLPSPPNPPGVLVRLQFPDAHTLLISTNSQTFGATAQRLRSRSRNRLPPSTSPTAPRPSTRMAPRGCSRRRQPASRPTSASSFRSRQK